MNCEELKREIAELGDKLQVYKKFCKDSETNGWRMPEIEKAQQKFDQAADTLLEKYLLDFREKFTEVSNMKLTGRLENSSPDMLGSCKVITLWGGKAVVSGDSPSTLEAHLIVENEDGSLSVGEKIEAFRSMSFGDFVEISGERCLVVDEGRRLSIVAKNGNTFTDMGEILGDPVGPVMRIEALGSHEWAILGMDGICVLTENEKGKFSFSGKSEWKAEKILPKNVLPLGDKAILINEGLLETRVLVKNQDSNNLQEIDTPMRGWAVHDVINVSDNEWIIQKMDFFHFGWAVLVNDGSRYVVHNEFRKIDGLAVNSIEHLSGNDVLIDLEGGGFFVYTVNSDGTLTKKENIGYDYPSGCRMRKVIPIDRHRWLLNANVGVRADPNSYSVNECESYVIHKRASGEYELAERINELFYEVDSLAPLPGGRFLVDRGTIAPVADQIVDFRGNTINNPLNSGHERDILGAVSIINDIESLKKNLDRIIESGS